MLPEEQISATLSRSWKWIIALAVILIVGGTLAILMPFISSLVITTWVGITFLVAGGAQVIQAFSAQGWKGTGMHMLCGALYIIGGLVLIFDPLAGMIALSLIVVATLLASGVLRMYAAWQLRPEDGWGWIMAGGALAVAAGLVIWANFPGASVWLLGLIAGISFIGEGWALLFIGIAARKLAKGAEAAGA